MNQKHLTVLVAVIFFIVCFAALRFLTPEDTWICENGSWQKHGNPSESQPNKNCGTSTNTTTENNTNNQNNETAASTATTTIKWHDYSSSKGVAFRLYDFYEGKEIDGSPLIIKGEVPGNWFFEANFPVTLTDWDGRIIGQAVAQADSDWMTTEMVPFTVTINFEKPSLYPRGSIIFKKDNPSGLPANDDYLEFMINYKDINPVPQE